MQFGTNHLVIRVTNLLLAHITGRVVTVAPRAHRIGRIDFNYLNWQRKSYSPGPPTASPSWPTSCSRPSSSAG